MKSGSPEISLPCESDQCADDMVGKWISIKGTLRTTTLPGGYKLNFDKDGPGAPNPEIP